MNGRTLVASIAYAVFALAAVLFALTRGAPVLLVVALGLCALPLLLYALVRRPGVFVVLPGIVLGFMPFAAVPGTGAPLAVLLGAALVAVAVVHPSTARPRLGPVGVAVVVLLAAAAISMLGNYNGFAAIWEYLKWAIATGTTLVALRLADPLRRAMMRAFVVSASAGAIVTMGMLVIDPAGTWVERFGFLGYGGSAAVNSRTAMVGGSEVLRAAGLYVDPNSAGLVFLMAAGVAGTAFGGIMRLATLAVLIAGIAGTLSRSAIVSIIVAMLVLVVVSRLDAGRRLLLVGAGAAALAAILLVPAISSRLFDSFSGRDVGASARADALASYPRQMDGAWLFGHGWYLREFWDPVYGFHVNYAANTPLVVIYRGGIVVGLVFVVLLVLGLVVSVRAMRRGQSGAGIGGGVLFGLVFVAFQLDFPVVTMPPLAMCFALLLAEVQALDRIDPPEPRDAEQSSARPTPHLTVPLRTGALV